MSGLMMLPRLRPPVGMFNALNIFPEASSPVAGTLLTEVVDADEIDDSW